MCGWRPPNDRSASNWPATSEGDSSLFGAATRLIAEEVHVVHVLPELAQSEPMVLWEAWESQKRHKHAEDELRKFLAGDRYVGLALHVFVGDPGQEITALAERLGAELIVLPSHGRTGLKRLLIGSVAERVVRLAHCPVLVLRK